MTDGSWPMWLTVREVGLSILATASSGTSRAGRRAHLQAAQDLAGIGVLRVGLEDHLIGVVGGVDGRDLPRTKGRVEQVADLVDRDAEPRGEVAVDVDTSRAGSDLQVGIHVEDAGNRLHPRHQFWRVGAQGLEIARLQPYWYWLREDSAPTRSTGPAGKRR